MSMPDLAQTLRTAKTIAVVGASPNPYRTSHSIMRYLMDAGYTVIPVNPTYDNVLGETCYPSLQAIPEDIHLDIVNIFRRDIYTADVVDDATARQASTNEHPVIWTQLGVSSPEAQQKATAANLPYVAERCIMLAHGRLASA